jgi:hypothetical protein
MDDCCSFLNRADITFMLISTSDFLLSMCDSLGCALEPSSNQKEIRGIHNSCCHLLACFAYVCCPLDVLVQFLSGSLPTNEEEQHGHLSHWMHWVRPQTFTAPRWVTQHCMLTGKCVYIKCRYYC